MLNSRGIAFSMVGLAVTVSIAPAADTLPTSDEIHRAFDEAKYQDTLRDIAHVLSIHGESAKQYDRYDLLMLKAESLLKIKSAASAAQAFSEAARLAPDRNAKAVDEATDLLIRKSSGLAYRPHPAEKNGHSASHFNDPDPSTPGIDIIDPGKRKEALSALFEDESSSITVRLKGALEGKSLQPILTVVKGARELRSLEIAAKGNDDGTKDLVSQLAEHAKELLKDALRSMDDRVDSIKKAADEEIHYQIPVPDGKGKYHGEDHIRRRGLDGSQTRELNGYLSDSSKIPPATKDLMEALGADANYFEEVVKRAQALHQKAYDVLHADYTTNYYGNR